MKTPLERIAQRIAVYQNSILTCETEILQAAIEMANAQEPITEEKLLHLVNRHQMLRYQIMDMRDLATQIA